MDPVEVVPRSSPRAISSPGGGNAAAADAQNQRLAGPQLAKPRRRRCRRRTPASKSGAQSRVLQVYKFSSRAPNINVHYNGRGASGLSEIPALPDDGNILEMLARSASYWRHQEPARCWVRDCTCSAAHPPSRASLLQHHLKGEEDHLISLLREEFFSMVEVDGGSAGDSGSAVSQADAESDDERRRFVEEYSLVPLSRRKVYSAQTFHEQVEEYFRRL